ncbi:MAG: LysR family transcriptional regulator [Arenicella sp.]
MEKIDIDTRWLQDFVVLGETLSFSESAKIRMISQAAFSRRISSLEHNLEVLLIDRSTKPIQLTPEGQTFLLIAQQALEQLDHFKNKE